MTTLEASASEEPLETQFTIGGTLRLAVAALGINPWLLVLPAAAQVVNVLLGPTPSLTPAPYPWRSMAGPLLVGLVLIATYGGLLRATLATLSGERWGLGRIAVIGLQTCPRMVATGLLSMWPVCVSYGFIFAGVGSMASRIRGGASGEPALLLLIPMFVGLICLPFAFAAMFRWVLAVPIACEEGLIVKALGRSSALTKGHRWRLAGLFLVVFLFGGLVGSVSFSISLAAGNSLLVRVPLGAVTGCLSSIFAGVYVMSYELLRRQHDGLASEAAQAFA